MRTLTLFALWFCVGVHAEEPIEVEVVLTEVETVTASDEGVVEVDRATDQCRVVYLDRVETREQGKVKTRLQYLIEGTTVEEVQLTVDGEPEPAERDEVKSVVCGKHVRQTWVGEEGALQEVVGGDTPLLFDFESETLLFDAQRVVGSPAAKEQTLSGKDFLALPAKKRLDTLPNPVRPLLLELAEAAAEAAFSKGELRSVRWAVEVSEDKASLVCRVQLEGGFAEDEVVYEVELRVTTRTPSRAFPPAPR